jgi:membrane-bound lytic murein transglycosylase B
VAVPPRRILAGTTASVLVLGLAVAISGARAATVVSTPMAPVAPRLLPEDYASYVRAAAACPGLDPLLLTAIHDVETGRDAHGETSTAGAIGPMQFLPDTWAAYGVDANNDGVADPLNLTDALAAATRLLCRNGVAENATHETAIWNYNHSWSYVRSVLARAAELHRRLGI